MPSVGAVVARMRGKLHNHTCVLCQGFYFDACSTPAVNGACSCATGHGRPLWLENHDPAPCCLEFTGPANVWDIERYALAGPGPWFQCARCKRAHGYLPSSGRRRSRGTN